MPIQIYKMLDDKSGSTPAIQIAMAEAGSANQAGYGVFWTVNEFTGPRRIENLERVNAWAIDMDEDPKDEQLERIKSGLVPTSIIETKRGFQVYWKAKDAKPEHWNSIVLDRLVPFYGADKRARDLARIMRVPGFWHQKDPQNKFMVESIWDKPISYTEFQMASFYPDRSAPAREAFIKKQSEECSETNTIWEQVWRMDCMEALDRISGDECVGGEVYSFRRNNSGTHNIFSNGRGTSCWIDRDMRIGSLDGGGPSIFQWINWFHKNPSVTVQHMKRIFQELKWNK